MKRMHGIPLACVAGWALLAIAWPRNVFAADAVDPLTAEALTVEQAMRLPENQWEIKLPALKTLTPEVAATLAKCPGPLTLHGLTTISPEAVESLATCPGWDGDLSGLTALTPGVAAAVAGRKQGITLGIAAFDSPDSIDLARTLAGKRGPLALPNLKRISAKTLTNLIAKEDVVIPPVETLELISEPDGSAGEDFVIPQGFQQGPRR